jgi:hypothetical protein
MGAALTVRRLTSMAEAAADVQHRQKRARISDDDRPVLDRDQVLDTVFSFVGIGDYCYVAGVCRNWRGRYLTLCKQAAETMRRRLHTLRMNTVVTASRLQLALDDGVTIAKLTKHKWRLAHAIATRSLEPIAVLTLARVYGLQWTEALTEVAAQHKKYELLRWLIQCGCPCDIGRLVNGSHHCKNLIYLTRVRAATGPWPIKVMMSLRDFAARYDELDTVKWCHEQGAAWPTSFYYHFEDKYNIGRFPSRCWSLKCVQWALAYGSTWLTWRCQELAPKDFGCGSAGAEHNDDTCSNRNCERTHATELFSWAHENGCPCTCNEVA